MSLQPLVPNRLDDENSALVILDQTLLPNEVKYLALHTNEEICHAIKTLQVRGAPAIGVAAGYGAYLGAKAAPEDSFEAFYNYFLNNHSFPFCHPDRIQFSSGEPQRNLIVRCTESFELYQGSSSYR